MVVEDPTQRILALESQVQRLQAELEQRDRRDQKMARATLGLAGRFSLGRRLHKSFRAWLTRASLRNPLPVDETAGVLTALVRRYAWISLLGLVLSLTPTVFLFWQNMLIQDQIQLQEADSQIVRRAQLLAAIYAEPTSEHPAIEDPESIGTKFESMLDRDPRISSCRHRSAGDLRSRYEAVVAFLRIERAGIRKPDMSSAPLSCLDLDHIELGDADLSLADLRSASFVGADISQADLFGAKLALADFAQAALTGANLAGADLAGAKLVAADLAGANLKLATTRAANFRDANLTGAALAGAELDATDLTRADLVAADLSRADARSATFTGADLREAILTSADLTGADLTGADLTGAALDLANLSKANLTDAHLNQDQLENTYGHATTLLPDGLTPPAHWLEETPKQ